MFKGLFAAATAGALLLFASGALASAEPDERIQVMVVATYHMDSPGLDMVNTRADDVLTPLRQSEIAAVVDGLSRFRPTLIALEMPEAVVERRWPEYEAGGLRNSRNEVVQLGFRLADLAGARPIGVDVDGEFPFGPVAALAEETGRGHMIATGMEVAHAQTSGSEAALASGGVGAALRYQNDPAYARDGHSQYMGMLRIGQGERQPGVDLLTSWYSRNIHTCAKVLQAAKPGDRIVVIFGAGHATLLRQCFAAVPGVTLVDPLPYLAAD